MSHYTPTTNEVRTGFAVDEFGYWFEDDQGAEFDRWLTAHDAEVTAQAVTAERQVIAGWLNLHRDLPDKWWDDERVADLCGDESCLWWELSHNLAQAIRNGEHVKGQA